MCVKSWENYLPLIFRHKVYNLDVQNTQTIKIGQ